MKSKLFCPLKFLALPLLLAGCGQSGQDQSRAIADLQKQINEIKTETLQLQAKQTDLRDQRIEALEAENRMLQQQLAQLAKPVPSPRPKPVPDDSAGEIPIVEEGDNIVTNVAGSNGTRYLLVEIYLTRANENDRDFRQAIMAKSKTLKKTVIDRVSVLNMAQSSDPAVRVRIMAQLKMEFQRILSEDHPIKDVILATWVMQ